MGEKKQITISLKTLILIILVILILLGIIGYGTLLAIKNGLNQDKYTSEEDAVINTTIIDDTVNHNQKDDNSDTVNNNIEGVNEFDLAFLKEENEEINKVYSPLSIRYALKMLEEGADGDTKKQISSVLGTKELPKYEVSENLSLANALFVKSSEFETINEDYINDLKNNYNAEVIKDSFKTPDNINLWIKNKTLNIIDNLINEINPETNFMLVNALAIDMEWKNKFLDEESSVTDFYTEYKHEEFSWGTDPTISEFKFNDKYQVSGMEIIASVNNYDIVEELGEEKIFSTVKDAYTSWAKGETGDMYVNTFDLDPTEENINTQFDYYMYGNTENDTEYDDKGYLKELDENYGQINYTTDFEYFVDDDIKVFAKDLKEYNGTTLQYVGIMPTSEDLDSYVENITANKINEILESLKSLTLEDSKKGVVTKITGFIPKFNFDYKLNLEEDLKSLGINDVFDQEKADLSKLSNMDEAYISDAIHKADIEFTQDGIKAGAVTAFGGLGAGIEFDYYFDVPVEEIDLTFDKPYMFLIIDKSSNDVWFTGTVYEPLLWEEDTTKPEFY